MSAAYVVAAKVVLSFVLPVGAGRKITANLVFETTEFGSVRRAAEVKKADMCL